MGRRNRRAAKRKNISLAPCPTGMAAPQLTRGDIGPDTQAQRRGKVIEGAKWWDEDKKEWVNPNNMRRARRINVIEMYERKGVLTREQASAADRLSLAYEATFKSPPAIKKVQVDTCPNPDAHIAIQVDRISRFSAIMALVKDEDREIVSCVVLENNIPAHLKRYRGPKYQAGLAHLQSALSHLADSLD